MAKGYKSGITGASVSSELKNDSSIPGESVSDALDNLEQLHFGAFSTSTITVGTDPNNPTYVSGVSLFASSSSEFVLLNSATGLVKNTSNKTFSMQGSVTYQINNGTGGAAELNLWSERSDDDGVTFTENVGSLRTSEISNTAASSQTKSSAVQLWSPGESIRWAMYNSAAGTVTLEPPAATVNGGNNITGFSFFWQLNEVQ